MANKYTGNIDGFFCEVNCDSELEPGDSITFQLEELNRENLERALLPEYGLKWYCRIWFAIRRLLKRRVF